MNNRIQVFTDLVNKYKLVWEVPEEIRKTILKSRKSSLVKTLKITGEYGYVFNIIISLNLFARNIGLRLSLLSTKIILAVIVFSAASASGAVLYIFSKDTTTKEDKKQAIRESIPLNKGRKKKELSGNNKPEKTNKIDLFNNRSSSNYNAYKDEKKINGESENKIPENTDLNIEKKNSGIKYRVGIENFSGNNKKYTGIVKNKILDELTRLKGNEMITDYTARNSKKNINIILTGNVLKMKDRYMITVKLIDVEKSKIIYLKSKNKLLQKNINNACIEISREISDKIK